MTRQTTYLAIAIVVFIAGCGDTSTPPSDQSTAMSIPNDVTYTIKVHSYGGAGAANSTLTDILSDDLFLLSVGTTQGTCVVSGDTVTCDFGTIAVGDSVVVTLVATVRSNCTPVPWFIDSDNDGYGELFGVVQMACNQPVGYVANNTDCDDGEPDINPGMPENCKNQIDDDCDMLSDCEDPDCGCGPYGEPVPQGMDDLRYYGDYFDED